MGFGGAEMNAIQKIRYNSDQLKSVNKEKKKNDTKRTGKKLTEHKKLTEKEHADMLERVAKQARKEHRVNLIRTIIGLSIACYVLFKAFQLLFLYM